MYTAVIVFMALVAAMCVFSVTVIVIDLKRSKKPSDHDSATTATQSAQTVAATASVASAAAVAAVEDEQAVVFSAQKMTHTEKYAQLDDESKTWYNTVAAHAAAVPQIKRVQNDKCEEFRLFGKRIVRLSIKKGVVHCEYCIVNVEFNRYVVNGKLAVKHTATIIKLVSEREVVAAENAVDIAVAIVRRERNEKHQRDLERRREARRQRTASSDN